MQTPSVSKPLTRSGAAFCIVPNQRRGANMAAELKTDKPIHCIWNCPSSTEVTVSSNTAVNEPLWIYYHGSINESRLPPTVIEAIALLGSGVRLKVTGYETIGSPAYVSRLRNIAHDLGVNHLVQFEGAVPRGDELWKRAQQCHIGLALVRSMNADSNLLNLVGASNKPFDYMACGLAMLVAELPEWIATYVEPGYGLACDPESPESIASAFNWFLEHPEERATMGARGKQRIREEWNYERQFESVRSILEVASG